jgi:60 kDa SS-A/Ro ribonucleoprotein
MGSRDLTNEDKLKRFLYTGTPRGYYITGNSAARHFDKLPAIVPITWIESSTQDFLNVLKSVNEDSLLSRRSNLFYVLAEAMTEKQLSASARQDIKKTVLELVKADEEFFDFIQYHTKTRNPNSKMSTSLKKIIVKFYQDKRPQDLAVCVTKHDSYHKWTHKDLFKLCHFKTDNVQCEPVIKYVLYGATKLPEATDPVSKSIVDYLEKSNRLKVTEDVPEAVGLITQLHFTIDRVNSKLNKEEAVWLACLSEMTTREVLQCLFRFYKWGFIKANSEFHEKTNRMLVDAHKITQCNLHPIEVFIYLKFFEKGGKCLDPKFLAYLNQMELEADVLRRITTPIQPKCKPIIQSIKKCLKLSYSNVRPTEKRFLVCVDATAHGDLNCYQNRRITYLEAAHAVIRYLLKVETNVSVAVFKDSQIQFVDLSKSHNAVEKMQELRGSYIDPTAPLEWAMNKKKTFDVFINIMTNDWLEHVPQQSKKKAEKVPEALAKYCKKMNLPETRVVKMFLASPAGVHADNCRNILSIAGFTVDVPKVLEAFCRGHFC